MDKISPKITHEQVLACAVDIGAQLLKNGAEVWRVEHTIHRICKAYGMRRIHVFSIASMVMASVETPEGHWLSQSRRVARYGIDMTKLDRLNDLSRHICAQPHSYQDVRDKFEAVRAIKAYPLKIQCLMGALIGGAFTVFFGGSLRDGCAALLVGALIRLLVFMLERPFIMAMLANTFTSFVAGLACIATCRLGMGQNLDAIMIGNIMLLIPGVILTNSFRDFISGDTMTGMLHFMEALLIAFCVAGGFAAAMLATGGHL